jgi:2-iminobutanoate/2-iminopropanoate deaminase
MTSSASALRRTVNVTDIPQPLAHKSMAVVSGNLVFVSGQLGKGPDGTILPTVQEQIEQVFRQLDAILRAAGSDLNHVLRMGMYVTDIDYMMQISDYKKKLIPHDPPASFGYQVQALALGAALEIEVVAVLAEPQD